MLDLQRAAGNQAALVARSAAGDPKLYGPSALPAVQRDELGQGGTGYKTGMSEQVELKLGLNDPKRRVKISGKVTASRRGSKYLESPTGQVGPADAKWSLGENKAALERAGGRTATKLASALARADFSSPHLPGFPALRVRMSLKALEGKFDMATSEADLDLIKVTGAIDGDLVELLDDAGLAHLKDRVACKLSVEAEVALSVMDLSRLKAAWRAKEEVKAAAAAAEKHGADFAKRAEELKKLDGEHKKLMTDLDRRRSALAKSQARVEAAKAKAVPKSKKAAARLRNQIANLERQQTKAAKALQAVETKVAANRTAVKSASAAARASKAGLAEAGQKLMKAGQKLDGALRGVTGKLGQFGKKALEKTTKRIMAKLGKTLLMKGLAKLVPGLNILSTAYDIGSLLWGLASGDLKFGIPGLDESGADGDGGEEGGDGGAGGGSGGADGAASGDAPDGADAADAADAGDAAGASGGAQQAGGDASGTGGPTSVTLSTTAEALVKAYAGSGTTVDDDAAAAINEGLPSDITAAELVALVERIKAKHAGGPIDPYELVAQVAAELADLRAGGTTVTIDGKQQAADAGTDVAEPPKSLLPGTRADVQQILVFDRKADEVTVDPARRPALLAHTFNHADGLAVKLSSIDVTSRRPGGAGENLMVSVSVTTEVVALPSGAAQDYPYKVGQSETEKMTFLYNPRRKLWGEMDYSAQHKLLPVVRRDGAGWVLAAPDELVEFEHATVKVKALAASRSISTADGTVHRFVLDVVPVKILSEEAGYMNPTGWVKFQIGHTARIGFSFTETAAPVAP